MGSDRRLLPRINQDEVSTEPGQRRTDIVLMRSRWRGAPAPRSCRASASTDLNGGELMISLVAVSDVERSPMIRRRQVVERVQTGGDDVALSDAGVKTHSHCDLDAP
jgi:hypothetical protein